MYVSIISNNNGEKEADCILEHPHLSPLLLFILYNSNRTEEETVPFGEK
jgi:hypothetical protein